MPHPGDPLRLCLTQAVTLWEEGSGKGQWPLPTFLSGRKLSPSSCLDARHFNSSLCATVVFQAATPVLELRRSESEQVSPCVGSLRGIAWGYRNFFCQLSPYRFLQQEVVGTYLPGTGILGREPGVGLGLLSPEISLPLFICHMWVRDRPFCIPASPLYLPVWIDVISSLIPWLQDLNLTRFLQVLSDGCSVV